MPNTKRASKRRGRKEAVPVVGVVGVSLSLAGGASAATAVPTADTPSWDTGRAQITLNEEEIADVSLATFYVFDKENAGTPRLGEKLRRRRLRLLFVVGRLRLLLDMARLLGMARSIQLRDPDRQDPGFLFGAPRIK